MTETALKQKPQEPLYVSDDELYGLLGVPKDRARDAIAVLDHDPKSGFPRKQKLWGDKRYLPAVRAYFDRINGVSVERRKRDE